MATPSVLCALTYVLLADSAGTEERFDVLTTYDVPEDGPAASPTAWEGFAEPTVRVKIAEVNVEPRTAQWQADLPALTKAIERLLVQRVEHFQWCAERQTSLDGPIVSLTVGFSAQPPRVEAPEHPALAACLTPFAAVWPVPEQAAATHVVVQLGVSQGVERSAAP